MSSDYADLMNSGSYESVFPLGLCCCPCQSACPNFASDDESLIPCWQCVYQW